MPNPEVESEEDEPVPSTVAAPTTAPAKLSKKKKKQPESDTEPPAKKKKKAPRPKKPVEEEEEEEEEENGEEVEDGEEDAETAEQNEQHAAFRRKVKRAVARGNGYRDLSMQSGFSKSMSMKGNGTLDQTDHALTVSDIRRMVHFCPCTASNPSYNLEEFTARQNIAFEPIAEGAALVLQSNAEAVARKVMNQLVGNMVSAGVKRSTPSMLRNILRPIVENMELSCMAPIGLVRHGQDYKELKRVSTGPGRAKMVEKEVLLRMAPNDAEMRDEETRTSADIKKVMSTATKAEKERKARAAAKRAEAKQKRQAATVSVN